MKKRSFRSYAFSSQPSHMRWAAAWLVPALLLVLALLGACEAGPSPAPSVSSERPPARSTASPTSRSPVPSDKPATTAPYPPQPGQPTQPAEAYPAYPQPTLPAQPDTSGWPYRYWFPLLEGPGERPTATPLPTSTAPTDTPAPVKPTDTPRPPEPTDTPRPPWPAPLSGQTTSKLGLHIIAVYPDPDIMEFVSRVHPRVVMSPYDQEGLAKIKAASPSTVTISRFDVSGQEEWVRTVPDAAAAANHYVEVNLEHYRQNPAIDYWEGMNEFAPQTPEEWQWFAQYEATRACAMQAQGLHAAIGAFPVGYPRTFDEMTAFLPALEAAHRCGGILTIHEYNGPTMDCGVVTNVPNIIPGAPAVSVPAGIYTLRYRILYEGLLKPRGLGDLPLAITELGADGGSPKDGCQGPGHGWTWKRYQQWWVGQGFGAIGAEAYVNVLAWYDAEMKKDPYVIGAAIFTSGEFATTAWANFDIHEAIIHLAIYETRP